MLIRDPPNGLVYTDKPNLRVMSVKGKKVLHIDRNDHYGGFVAFPTCMRVND